MTYYIDYISGKDYPTNSGLSTNAPWQHHPYMANGTTFGYNHQPGDHFVFKGGVTWPNQCFPLIITGGGVAAIDDYYGMDVSWHAGVVASKPVFDAGGSLIADFSFYGDGMIYADADSWPSNVVIDGIEFTGGYFDSTANTGSGYILAGQVTNWGIINCLFTNWTHDTAGNGAQDKFNCIEGSTSLLNPGCYASNCVFDGRPNGTDSGDAIYCWPRIINCTIGNLMSGPLANGNPCIMSGCDVGPLNASFSGAHGAGFEPQGQVGAQYCFNNVFHDCSEVNIGIGLSPGPSGPAYVYNNIIYNSTVGVLLKWVAGAANQASIYGNAIDVSQSPVYSVLSELGEWDTINARNNLIIGGPPINISATNQTIDHNLSLTVNQASFYGYTAANLYAPVSTNAPTVGAAVNLTSTFASLSLSTLDRLGIQRPASGAWDIGPYEFQPGGGGGGGGPSPGAPITITLSSLAKLKINVTNNSPFTISISQ